MAKNVLENFYYEGLMPREMCCPRRKEYRDTIQLCETVEQELASHLSPELAALFQDYKEYMSQIATLESEEHFVQGMALGMRMTAEAFILDEEKTK